MTCWPTMNVNLFDKIWSVESLTCWPTVMFEKIRNVQGLTC